MSNRRRPQREAEKPDDWDFFRFEVFVAFFGGIFLSAMLISFELGGYVGPLHFGLLVVSLFAISWSLSRGISRFIVSRRTQRRLNRADEEERERRALAARAAAASEAGPEARRRRRRRKA